MEHLETETISSKSIISPCPISPKQSIPSSSQSSKPSSSSEAFVTASSNNSATGVVIINVAPSTADSEESYLDSLDEARTPLLAYQVQNNNQDFESDDEDYDFQETNGVNFNSDGVTPRQRTGIRTANSAVENLVINSIVHSETVKSSNQNRCRIPRDRYKALVINFL